MIGNFAACFLIIIKDHLFFGQSKWFLAKAPKKPKYFVLEDIQFWSAFGRLAP
jgi:hypothetical protein